MSTFKNIKPGDRVAWTDSRGIKHWGRAQLSGCHHTYIEVDVGGAYGYRVNVTEYNYSEHKPPGPIVRGWAVDVTPEAA